MLELILTRPQERPLIEAAQGLQFLVLDELHTYRGRQGADVALLVRRVREVLAAPQLQCVGTSATLAGAGSLAEQKAQVARVASQFFGVAVRPEHVVGETLRRATPARVEHDPTFLAALTERVADPAYPPALDYDGFIRDPLSIWIEGHFGVEPEPESGRLVRVRPRSIEGPRGAASELSLLTGVPVERCVQAIQDGLSASYRCERDPNTGRAPFAFRLHQFISRGDTVYASIDPEADRRLTLQGQQFVPNDRQRVLLPLVFCRECGQEYYCVRLIADEGSPRSYLVPRELTDRSGDENNAPGYLYVSSENPWPAGDLDALIDRLPDDWIEEHRGEMRVKRSRQADLPQPVRLGPDGVLSFEGLDGHFLPAPFRFCLSCGVA